MMRIQGSDVPLVTVLTEGLKAYAMALVVRGKAQKKQSSYFEEAVEDISNYRAEEDKLSEYY